MRDYLADRDDRPEGTRVAMAHRRADVRAINDAIRAELQDRGELAQGEDAGALTFQTNDGKREFAPGDRIVFLENNRDLGVKNGMLGTVEHVEAGRIVAQLDGRGGDSVSVPMGDYQAIDHGYATTIHKNQGATVDRSYVMASGTMDRHLTYVAMTRHRDGVQLYAAQDEFTNAGQALAAGRLVEHGAAPYEQPPGKSDSYFVTLENAKGEQRTLWGVDLERAMKEAGPEIGEKIGLQHLGSTPVTLPDGTETHRNAWKVQDAGELAYDQLERRLSRSGVKETTLDYTRDFAERRGIAEQMGVRSEIEIPAERAGLRPDRESTAGDHALDRRSSQKIRADLAQDLRADPREDLAQDRAGDRQQRQRPFEGLKLGRGTAADGPQQERGGEDGPQIDQKRPQQAEKQRRGMFAGLKLNVGSGARPAPSQEHTERPEREGSLRQAPAPDRLAERARRQSPLEQAVDRYARAYQSVAEHRREGLPVLDMQRQEMRDAGQQLDQLQGGMKDLMRSTLQNDPETARAMTELSGRERVAHLIDGMKRENAALQDPNVRAERFVNRWQELDGQRQQLRGWQHDEARGKVESQMNGLTKSLERDPQVDSILRNRRQELGIGQELRRGQSIAHQLQEEMTRGQRLSRGIGMSM